MKKPTSLQVGYAALIFAIVFAISVAIWITVDTLNQDDDSQGEFETRTQTFNAGEIWTIEHDGVRCFVFDGRQAGGLDCDWEAIPR